MRTIDAIAEILKKEGIHILPSFPTTPVIEAAAAAGIKPVICRQERVGVGIADGWTRVRNGSPAGAFAMQYGPGAENAFAGVSTAFSDAVPMLLLPLGHPLERDRVFPNFSSLRTYESVTKFAEQVNGGQEPTSTSAQAATTAKLNMARCRAAKVLSVQVNPQFGRFDYSQVAVVAAPGIVARPAGPAKAPSTSGLTPAC